MMLYVNRLETQVCFQSLFAVIMNSIDKVTLSVQFFVFLLEK